MNGNYEKLNKIIQENDLNLNIEDPCLPAVIIGSLNNWREQEHHLILFILHLKQGLKSNQAQDILKSLSYLTSTSTSTLTSNKIIQELSRFQSVTVQCNANLNLSEREQKCQYLARLDTSESSLLYGLSFLLAKPEAHTAGLMLGSCEHIITDLTSRDVNGILRYYTHNEIINIFMDRINQFAKVSTRLKLFTPEIKYIYIYFLNTFKKQILLINK